MGSPIIASCVFDSPNSIVTVEAPAFQAGNADRKVADVNDCLADLSHVGVWGIKLKLHRRRAGKETALHAWLPALRQVYLAYKQARHISQKHMHVATYPSGVRGSGRAGCDLGFCDLRTSDACVCNSYMPKGFEVTLSYLAKA